MDEPPNYPPPPLPSYTQEDEIEMEEFDLHLEEEPEKDSVFDTEEATKLARASLFLNKEQQQYGIFKGSIAPLGKGVAFLFRLQIEETNIIRARLGLAPLDVETEEDKVRLQPSLPNKQAAKQKEIDETHATAQREAEANVYRDKIERARKRRELNKELVGNKLGDSDDDLDDAAAWIARSRSKAQEQAKAKANARRYDEEDEEAQQYSATDLAGMKVSHNLDEFAPGQEVVLTLADRGVIKKMDGGKYVEDDEAEPLELENALMREDRQRSDEIRTGRRPLYDPYGDQATEVQAHGDAVGTNILQKYNDQRLESGVMLGKGGQFDQLEAHQQEEDRTRLKAIASGKQLYSLGEGSIAVNVQSSDPTIAEYLKDDPSEVKFSKRKKRRVKKRKTESTLASLGENLDLDAVRGPDADHGSRNMHRQSMLQADQDQQTELATREEGYQAARKKAAEKAQQQFDAHSDGDDGDEGVAGSIIRARVERLSTWQSVPGSVTINEEEATAAAPSAMVFSDAIEFVDTLDTVKADDLLEEVVEEEVPFVEMDEIEPQAAFEMMGLKKIKTGSVAAALQRIQAEGLHTAKADADVWSGRRGDKKIPDGADDVKSKPPTQRRSSAPLRDATGKIIKREEDFDFDVHLDYVDSVGRRLTPKEAFRQECYMFHGQMPGKKQQAKRLREIEQQEQQRRMSSVDTPLGMAGGMRDRLSQTQTPYIMLSANKGGLMSSLDGIDGTATASVDIQRQQKKKLTGPAAVKPRRVRK